jgi:hypothetical protein
MAHSAQFLKDYFGGEFTPSKMLSPISTAWKMTGATDVIDVGVSVPCLTFGTTKFSAFFLKVFHGYSPFLLPET